MAQDVRLDDLRLRVRQRGCWESESTRFTDATLTREISLSAMELRDMMLRAGLTHLFVQSATVTTVNGTSVYAVGSDGYYQVIAVTLDTGSAKIPLESFMEGERARLRNTYDVWSGTPMYYQLVGAGSIELLPIPTGVYSVEVRYIPPQPPLVADDDTLDGLNGLEEWVVCDVVRKLASAEKDATTVQVMDAMCARLEKRTLTMAGMRDRASFKRVVDVMSRPRRWMR